MKKTVFFFLTSVLALTLCSAFAQTPQEGVIAVVNGEPLYQSDYFAVENAYISEYTNAGYDLSDESLMGYVRDLALTSAIERMLTEQDMLAQGCYQFDQDLEDWMIQEGTAAYEQALLDVEETLRISLSLSEEEDMRPHALAYAQMLGVTQQDYIDVYRTQYATINYYDWLIRDNPITDADVQDAYQERIDSSRALYENDIPAFETALSSGLDVWFKPEGYRSVLQILLPANGVSEADRIAGVQDTLDLIEDRLAAGESFESLIREFGIDSSFEDESFFSTGYQVHPDSVIWEDAFVTAAFGEDMALPGDHSKPFASSLGVHVLYYLGDSAGGAVELSEELHHLLASQLYNERTQAALTARIDILADNAEVTIY